MKIKIYALALVVLLSLAFVGVALAQDAGLTVVKGTVQAFDAASLTVESVKGGSYTFTLPAGFTLPTLAIGDMVMVKGETQADGTLLATSVFPLTKGQKNGKGVGSKEPKEAGKLNRAFCDPAKQGVYHPLAESMSPKYGVSPDWVNGYYCDGQSMGAIMLALKTAQLKGLDPEGLMARHANGDSWGLIWQDLGLIGSEKDMQTPPGQYKK